MSETTSINTYKPINQLHKVLTLHYQKNWDTSFTNGQTSICMVSLNKIKIRNEVDLMEDIPSYTIKKELVIQSCYMYLNDDNIADSLDKKYKCFRMNSLVLLNVSTWKEFAEIHKYYLDHLDLSHYNIDKKEIDNLRKLSAWDLFLHLFPMNDIMLIEEDREQAFNWLHLKIDGYL